MKIAHINFYKDATKDNWKRGCIGKPQSIYFEKITIEFTDTKNLIEKMAKWLSNHFDVSTKMFVEYVNNECEINRFDYSQNEDVNGNYIIIDENNTDGYLCDYQFLVTQVTEKIEYTFDNINL